MSKEKEKNKEKKSEKKSDNPLIEKTNNEIILKFIDDFSNGTRIGITRELIDEESKKDFYSALDNPKISAATIVKALGEFGIKGNITTINRLRRQR